MARFLSWCGERGIRTVRIIHGKGYGSREQAPVLKSRLNHWLRDQQEVLAFCSSRRDQGGTGAVNVLLRSSR
jgi:DNA-nicking Smr family endonuclease